MFVNKLQLNSAEAVLNCSSTSDLMGTWDSLHFSSSALSLQRLKGGIFFQNQRHSQKNSPFHAWVKAFNSSAFIQQFVLKRMYTWRFHTVMFFKTKCAVYKHNNRTKLLRKIWKKSSRRDSWNFNISRIIKNQFSWRIVRRQFFLNYTKSWDRNLRF